MTKTRKSAGLVAATCALAFVALAAAPATAEAAASRPAPYQQIGAQQFKAPGGGGPGPVRPIAPKRLSTQSGNAANSNTGCHDYASQTSYEGPCDYYPEYESTGGCESSAEQASVPGNCPNSSEP